MVGISLRFLTGRFHATPWGRHVNESVPEWPPSPWRILRALVGTWARKLRHEFDTESIRAVLSQITEPPEFQLPYAKIGHCRQYMKIGPEKGFPEGKPTMVFDPFVTVAKPSSSEMTFDSSTDTAVLWHNVELTSQQRKILDVVLSYVGYLGRAESWCDAWLLTEANLQQIKPNCWPSNFDKNTEGTEAIRILCADPATTFANEYTPSVRQPKARNRKNNAKIPLYDPDWHLCMETRELHDKRWSDPPGSKWVTYSRLIDCFVVGPSRQATPRQRRTYSVARYAFDAPVLPLVQESLPLAEQARRVLMGVYRHIEEKRNPQGEKPRSATFSGKDDTGRKLEGHSHAFYLPTDEDGDGRIDHLTVIATNGFRENEVRAIDGLRRLRFGDGDPLNLLLVGLGEPSDFTAGPLRPSAVWESATPFLATRHPKRRGRKKDPPELLANKIQFVTRVLEEELERLRARRPDLPEPTEITPLPNEQEAFRIGPRQLRPIQFKRFRRKRGDDGGRRLAGAFRITFAKPVAGPFCLGHSSHFGMGLFLPSDLNRP